MPYNHFFLTQEKQAKKLIDEIETLLTPLSEVGLYELVKEPLTKRGRGLDIEIIRNRPWPLLPLIVCKAISGKYSHTLPAAAALQFLLAAGDVFDDIEDRDSSESLVAKCGSAIATNVATTLLILAQRSIVRLETRGVKSDVILRVFDIVNSYYNNVCVGQHLDLSVSFEMFFSEETYIRIIGMKSAIQIQCACHIGALLASANNELISIFKEFGYYVGIVAQITNDIHGIIYGNDIKNKKITLPIIFTLTHAKREIRNKLHLALDKQSEYTPDIIDIKNLLFSIGAIYYTTIRREFYKQKALDILSKVKDAGIKVAQLRLFLE